MHWDSKERGSLKVRELISSLMTLGVCSSKDLVIKMLCMILSRELSDEDNISLEEFMSIF